MIATQISCGDYYEYLNNKDVKVMSVDAQELLAEAAELLTTSERVQEEAYTKMSDLEALHSELETKNYELGEMVGTLESLAEVMDTIESCINDAEEFNIRA